MRRIVRESVQRAADAHLDEGRMVRLPEYVERYRPRFTPERVATAMAMLARRRAN